MYTESQTDISIKYLIFEIYSRRIYFLFVISFFWYTPPPRLRGKFLHYKVDQPKRKYENLNNEQTHFSENLKKEKNYEKETSNLSIILIFK